MTAGASRAAPTIAPQPALAPSPQPRPAPTARALPPGLVEQGGQNWTPIGGQILTPIDTYNSNAGADVRVGSFATDRCAMKIGPCPQCPESDGLPSKRRPSRWANNGLVRCTPALLTQSDDLLGGFEVYAHRRLSTLVDAPEQGQ